MVLYVITRADGRYYTMTLRGHIAWVPSVELAASYDDRRAAERVAASLSTSERRAYAVTYGGPHGLPA